MPMLAEPLTTCPPTAKGSSKQCLKRYAISSTSERLRTAATTTANSSPPEPSRVYRPAELRLHAQGRFLQVQVACLVPKPVIHLLELVEVDEDEAEDAGGLAGFGNHRAEVFLQREAVWHVGEKIELGAVNEIGVKARSFNRQRGQTRSQRQSRGLFRARLAKAMNGGKDGPQRGSGAAGNLAAARSSAR